MLTLKKLITRGVGVLLGAAFMSSGCQSSKKELDLQQWLDQEFPGEWKEEFGLRDLHPKHWGTKKTTSFLTSTRDSLVQMQVIWYKAESGLGLDKDWFAKAAKSSHEDVLHGKQLSMNTANAGCPPFSLAIVDSSLYVIFFGKGDPTDRNTALTCTQNLVKTSPIPLTQIRIEYLEAEAQKVHFNDIIPFNYWTIERGYHDDQKWMSLYCTPDELNDPSTLSEKWQLNSVAKRISSLRERAYEKALAWANTNLPSDLELKGTELTAFQPNPDDVISAQFEFPVEKKDISTETQEPDSTDHGYIAVTYHLDTDAFVDIKRINHQ